MAGPPKDQKGDREPESPVANETHQILPSVYHVLGVQTNSESGVYHIDILPSEQLLYAV